MPRKRDAAPPRYRRRLLSQGERAYVTLADAVTGRRRDFNLGAYGSPQSRQAYAELIRAWEVRGRRVDATPTTPTVLGVTVQEICERFLAEHAADYYGASERSSYQQLCRLTCAVAGALPAESFGPNVLREVRQAMVGLDWCRTSINRHMHRVRAVFKWAASHELLPVTIYQALTTVEPLRRGRTVARESEPVRPVPQWMVDATLPHCSAPVAALIRLQLLTGARPGELLALRPCDIVTSAAVWVHEPAEHKTAHHGHTRSIFFGPRAKRILKPFLEGRATTAYLFSPIDAEAERRARMHAGRETPLRQGNAPGTNKSASPKRPPGERYDVDSYRRAIAYACAKAWPLPADASADRKAWRREHSWHPHQLRHNYATTMRRERGIETASVMLGHRSIDVTEIYAEQDRGKALEVARRMG